jgi:hypothetical protein
MKRQKLCENAAAKSSMPIMGLQSKRAEQLSRNRVYAGI